MKTPDEIKKGLECAEIYICPDKDCPYYANQPCSEAVQKDALALIQQLEVERDAMATDIRMEGGLCSICKHADEMAHSESCRDCNALVVSDHSNWEWRGVQKEE